jgi:hypothetical protein
VCGVRTSRKHDTWEVASKRPTAAAIEGRQVMDPGAATHKAFYPEATSLPMLNMQRFLEISFANRLRTLDT